MVRDVLLWFSKLPGQVSCCRVEVGFRVRFRLLSEVIEFAPGTTIGDFGNGAVFSGELSALYFMEAFVASLFSGSKRLCFASFHLPPPGALGECAGIMGQHRSYVKRHFCRRGEGQLGGADENRDRIRVKNLSRARQIYLSSRKKDLFSFSNFCFRVATDRVFSIRDFACATA